MRRLNSRGSQLVSGGVLKELVERIGTPEEASDALRALELAWLRRAGSNRGGAHFSALAPWPADLDLAGSLVRRCLAAGAPDVALRAMRGAVSLGLPADEGALRALVDDAAGRGDARALLGAWLAATQNHARPSAGLVRAVAEGLRGAGHAGLAGKVVAEAELNGVAVGGDA